MSIGLLSCVGCYYYIGIPVEKVHISFGQIEMWQAAADPSCLDEIQRYPPGCEWYLTIRVNVKKEDPRSDAEILLSMLQAVKGDRRGDVTRTVDTGGGTVSLAQFVVMRDDSKVAEYTSGIVVPLDDVLDIEYKAERIAEESAIHGKPIIYSDELWKNVMMEDYKSGTFSRKRS